MSARRSTEDSSAEPAWLKHLIRLKLTSLYSQWVLTKTLPSDLEVNELKRLVDVATIRDAFVERPRRLFWVAAFLSLTAVLGTLLLLRTTTTDIDLAADVSDIRFRTTAHEQSLGSFSAKEIQIDDFACLSLPTQPPSNDCGGAGAANSVHVVTAAGSPRSSLSIDSWLLAPMSDVTLSSDVVDGSFSVKAPAEGSRYVLNIAFSSPVVVKWRGRTAHLTDTSAPIAVESGGSKPLKVTFPEAASPVIDLSPMITISGVWFETVVRVNSPIGSQVSMPRSSIIAGELFLKALNDKQVPIRPFDKLSLKLTEGEIRSMTVLHAKSLESSPTAGSLPEGDVNRATSMISQRIALELHGDTTALMLGGYRDYMPTLLEWLNARAIWLLYIAFVAYVSSLLIAVLKLARYID